MGCALRWEDEESGEKGTFADGNLMENNPTLQSFTDSTNLIRELNRQRAEGNELRLSAVLSLGCSHSDVKQVRLGLVRNEESVCHSELGAYE